MTNPLHAAFYADQCVHATVSVLENLEIARDTWRMRFEFPEMAARILPGQFLMARVAGVDDPLIGRPFALYDVVGHAADFVYLRHGKMTQALARLQAGQAVDVWGPLGNGFVPQPCQHLVMVAGGIGQTPFLAVAKERLGRQNYGHAMRNNFRLSRVTLCYGARSADRLAGVDDFRSAGVDVQIATDDGSLGHMGLVTDLLSAVLQQQSAGVHVVCCGPQPMMTATSRIASHHGVSCEVSLEEPMACGIGICFSCVARVCNEAGEWDWKRTCVEGPVFAADRIAWTVD